MRIFFDHQAFSIQSHGGISRYVLELGERLARQPGVELRLQAGWHRSLMLRDAAPAWAAGSYVPPVPKTGPLRLALNRWLVARDARRWRPAVIHENYFRRGNDYAPGVPSVLTVYDLIYFVLPDTRPEAAAVRRAQQEAVRRAAHVICISEQTRTDLLQFIPIDPARVSVVPLAGPALLTTVPPSPPVDGPYLLHVGLRHSYKNFTTLARAFATSERLRQEVRLVAFGGGDFTPHERAEFRSLGLDERQLLHRNGTEADLAAYYAHARALVCPSLYEGFGLPVLEAMARGCPVACGPRGALPEVAGDAALTLEPTDPASIAETLGQLLDSPALAADLARRGRARAAQFSWERCAAETLAIYRRLAD